MKRVMVKSLGEKINTAIVKAYFTSMLRWTEKNRNRVIFLVGDIGSGKSMVALTYKYILDSLRVGHPLSKNEFEWEDLVFTPDRFLERVDEAPRHVIIFDEAGVGAHARKWYDAVNIALSKVAQTFRYKRNIIIATVPRLKMVDKHLRDVAHEIHRASGRFIDDKYNEVFPRIIYYQPVEDKVYYVGPQIMVKMGDRMRFIKIKSFLIPLPPKWIVKKYEEMQEEIKNTIMKEAREEVVKAMRGEESTSPGQIVETILKVLEENPLVIEHIVTKNFKKGRVKFSPKKIEAFPYIEEIDYKTAKIVANKLNVLVFGDINGALEFEYNQAYEDGSIYNWIVKALSGVER